MEFCLPAAIETCPNLPPPGVEKLTVVMAKWGTMYNECKTKHDTLVECVNGQ